MQPEAMLEIGQGACRCRPPTCWKAAIHLVLSAWETKKKWCVVRVWSRMLKLCLPPTCSHASDDRSRLEKGVFSLPRG